MTVEWWAGNGGEMARAEKKAALKSKTRRKAAIGKKKVPKGVKILREAADETVGENSAKITASLLKATLKGKVGMAKLLIDLAALQQEKEDAKKKRRGRSTAQELAAEPEWRDEVIETLAETEPGSREPEG
ncbi:MAG: hypothetical protein ABSA48_08830 [Terracidiphilus sp.]|jgi:hypothetical protein